MQELLRGLDAERGRNMRKFIFSLTLMLSFGLVWAKSDKPDKSDKSDKHRSPESSLNSCQDAVRKEAQKFIHKKMDAIGRCLQDVSKEIVKKNELDASGAAKSCVRRFSKIDDLEAKLIEKINNKCDPLQDKVTHSLEDILGAGAGVLEPLEATNLDAYCTSFGGDGTIDSLSEWSSCVAAASECAVDSAIAVQFPRALEWMERVAPEMAASSADPAKIAEALANLAAVEAAIEGATDDNMPEISCGPSGTGTPDTGCPCNFKAALFPTLSATGADNSCTVVSGSSPHRSPIGP